MLTVARINQPFKIQRMTQEDFLDFGELVAACPRPRALKVTHAMAIRVCVSHPNEIYVSTEHDVQVWEMHISVPLRPLTTCRFPQKHLASILLPLNLLEDLRCLYPFIPLKSRVFWEFLN